MVGSNEEDWKEYNTDPEESFNTVRGFLWAIAIILVISGIVWLTT